MEKRMLIYSFLFIFAIILVSVEVSAPVADTECQICLKTCKTGSGTFDMANCDASCSSDKVTALSTCTTLKSDPSGNCYTLDCSVYLLSNGQTCTSNTQCLSGKCYSGVCVACYLDSHCGDGITTICDTSQYYSCKTYSYTSRLRTTSPPSETEQLRYKVRYAYYSSIFDSPLVYCCDSYTGSGKSSTDADPSAFWTCMNYFGGSDYKVTTPTEVIRLNNFIKEGENSLLGHAQFDDDLASCFAKNHNSGCTMCGAHESGFNTFTTGSYSFYPYCSTGGYVIAVACHDGVGYVAASSDAECIEAGNNLVCGLPSTSRTWYADGDNDGRGSVFDTRSANSNTMPGGYTADFGDCRDIDPTVYYGATEWCDGKDNDCDDIVDDSCTPFPCDKDCICDYDEDSASCSDCLDDKCTDAIGYCCVGGTNSGKWSRTASYAEFCTGGTVKTDYDCEAYLGCNGLSKDACKAKTKLDSYYNTVVPSCRWLLKSNPAGCVTCDNDGVCEAGETAANCNDCRTSSCGVCSLTTDCKDGLICDYDSHGDYNEVTKTYTNLNTIKRCHATTTKAIAKTCKEYSNNQFICLNPSLARPAYPNTADFNGGADWGAVDVCAVNEHCVDEQGCVACPAPETWDGTKCTGFSSCGYPGKIDTSTVALYCWAKAGLNNWPSTNRPESIVPMQAFPAAG